MKIDSYYQRQRCSVMKMNVVSGNIRFFFFGVRSNFNKLKTPDHESYVYVQGFLLDEAPNDSEVIKNVDFQCFQTLRLRNLNK